jgi:hypothetical protein
MHAPLKALDRLLSNRHLHQAIPSLYQSMMPWTLRGSHPVIVVDWSDLKGDGRWCLLRAATPVGSRTVTVYERIYPVKLLNSPQVQAAFVAELAQRLPPATVPILITDAGFRSDWFRAVTAQGWDYIGRIRNNVKVCKHCDMHWHPCKDLFAGATGRAEELGNHAIVQQRPWDCRLVRLRKHRKHRDQLTRKGTPQQGTCARKARKGAREPWLLATSLNPSHFSPSKVTALYAKRMQIELAFRDMKSHHYGVGLEDSLSQQAPRLAVLLVLHALASFAAWLLSLTLDTHPQPKDPLAARWKHRARYSPIRRAMEWLRRPWIPNIDLKSFEIQT